MKKLHIITIFCFILYIIYKLNRKSYVIEGQDSPGPGTTTGSGTTAGAGTTAGSGTTPDPLADLVAQAADAFQVELDLTQDLSNAAFPTYEGSFEAEKYY